MSSEATSLSDLLRLYELNTLSRLPVSLFFSLGLVRLLCTQNFTIKRYDACFGSVVDTCFGSVVMSGIIFSIKPG